jgi:hypothetical protein
MNETYVFAKGEIISDTDNLEAIGYHLSGDNECGISIVIVRNENINVSGVMTVKYSDDKLFYQVFLDGNIPEDLPLDGVVRDVITDKIYDIHYKDKNVHEVDKIDVTSLSSSVMLKDNFSYSNGYIGNIPSNYMLSIARKTQIMSAYYTLSKGDNAFNDIADFIENLYIVKIAIDSSIDQDIVIGAVSDVLLDRALIDYSSLDTGLKAYIKVIPMLSKHVFKEETEYYFAISKKIDENAITILYEYIREHANKDSICFDISYATRFEGLKMCYISEEYHVENCKISDYEAHTGEDAQTIFEHNIKMFLNTIN